MLKNLLRWCKITRAADDTKQFAVQQITYLGKLCETLMIFPYGLHGNVPPDSLGVTFAIQGNAENRGTIAWEPRSRPELQSGEVAFYHPPTGAHIIWRANGDLNIVAGDDGAANINIMCVQASIAASGSLTIDSPTTTISGDLLVQGATALGSVTSNGVDVGSTHRHSGVQSGGSNSGPPV